MADLSEEKFLHAYGTMLIKIWGDPDLKKRFKANPEEVCKEFGLDPEGAKVEIKPAGPLSNPQATKESQVMLWNTGKVSGSIHLYFPEDPPEDLEEAELSEEELASVAGGGCCCCSPCCSCCC
jgi:hypothetical protein